MNYKRISSYKKMNDIQAFINNKIQENISLSDIKKLIMDNYNINEQDAIDQINS